MTSAKDHLTTPCVRDDDINILLLGESGVGKSTFINSMANYLQYSTLDEALAEKLTCLIPSKFSMPDENFVTRQIQLGSDKNEDAEFGNSSTQGARSYVFRIQETICRIIDTPGIGDARGLEQDHENFENVLAYISQYKYLHGICFLLKPNVTVINPYFKFCIIHLLSRLEKSAAKNIIFVFTNSRGTFYRPGDTLQILRRILTDIQQSEPYVHIPCDKENMFCVDNEAFKFLAAMQQGIKFGEREIKEFGQSWITSCDAVKALILYVQNTKKLTPHQVENTLSINEARRNIIDLAKPLADITDFIRNNLVVLERHQLDINRENLSTEDLKKRLYVPSVVVNTIELTQPVTVCSSNKCTEILSHGGVTQRHYKQRCHNPCYLRNIPKEIVGDSGLQQCAAMDGAKQCKICKCDFSSHMHIYYETKTEQVNEEDTLVKSQIMSRSDLILKKNQVIAQIQQKSMEYQAEKDKILRTMAKFAYFLHENSISAYNDAYLDYLEYLIDREKNLGVNADKELLKHYNELKTNYQVEKNILEDAKKAAIRKNAKFSISISEVFDGIKNLFKLRWTGKTIQNFYSKQRNLTAKEVSQMEYLHPKAIGINKRKSVEELSDNDILKKLLCEPDAKTMREKLNKMKLAEKQKKRLSSIIETFAATIPKGDVAKTEPESPPPRAVRIKSKFDKEEMSDTAILSQLIRSGESDLHKMKDKLENMKLRGADADERKQRIWDLIEDLTTKSTDSPFNSAKKASAAPIPKGHTEFKAKNKQQRANNATRRNNLDETENLNMQRIDKKHNNLQNAGPENFAQNQNRGNFNQTRRNQNRNPNFNQNLPRYNQNRSNFDQVPRNFNQNSGPSIPSLFSINTNPGGFNQSPGNFNQNAGPGNFNKNPGGFNQGTGNFNQGPGNNQNPGNFNQNSGNFNQNPGNFNQNPGNFNQNPGNFNQNPGNFNQNPGNFGQNPGNFNQGSGNFNQNPGNFNQNPGNFNQNTGGNFNQNPGNNFNQNPGNNFNQNPGNNFNQNPGNNFNQNPGGNINQNSGGNFNQNPGGNFNQNPGGNFNQNSSGGFNQNTSGNFNPNPSGNFNQNTGGNFNPNPTGNFNQNPGGNFNQNSTGNFNQNPGNMNSSFNPNTGNQTPKANEATGNKNRKQKKNNQSNNSNVPVEAPPKYNEIFGDTPRQEQSSDDDEPEDLDDLLKQFRKMYALRKKDK